MNNTSLEQQIIDAMNAPLTKKQIERQVEIATNVVDKSYSMGEITYGKYKQLIAAINIWAEVEFAEGVNNNE